MKEHNFASISNTSIHEAYPGHHLQLDRARRHPSLTRLLTEAPEFVEGWGMYSELMMREQGFDADPAFRLVMHTDAIWRACRIILDVRMHRGEMTVDEAADFLVEQTSFEPSVARAEVDWYTYRPTYPLSYLLGRTLLLGLRADEQRRLGDAFSLKGFHDTLLDAGSLPISFQRRLLQGDAAAPATGRGLTPVQIIPAIDLEVGPVADRLLAGRRGRDRRPDRPPGAHRRAVRGDGREGHPPRRLRRRAGRRTGQPRGGRWRSRRASGSRSSWPAAWTPPMASASRSRPARPVSC